MKKHLNLIIFIIGLASLFAGIYMIFPPAAFIALGLVLIAVTTIGGEK
jgi:hypothetical protein